MSIVVFPGGRFHVAIKYLSLCYQAPNPTASEFIPKGAPRMATMAQSTVQAFPSPIFPHPALSSSTAAALAPGEGFFVL